MATSPVEALSQMWEAVERARDTSALSVSYVRPEKGFTVKEYSERYGIHPRTARDHAFRLFRNGLVDRVIVMLPNEIGALHRAWVYVPKENR